MDRLWLSSWAVAGLLIGGIAAGSVGCQAEAQGKPTADKQGAAGAKPGAGADKKPPAPIPVELVTLAPQRVARSAEATGTLVARDEVIVVSELSRRLTGIYVKDGQSVKRGQLLFKLDASDLTAQQRIIDARLKLARQTEGRLKELVSKSAISQQEYDRASSEVAVLEAERSALGVTLSRTAIRAPFDARAGFRLVSLGAWVGPTTPLITLTDTQSLLLDFTAPEELAPALKAGQPVSFRIAGRAQDFAATIAVVDPKVDAATRSLRVRAAVDPAQPGFEQLSPGALAQVRAELDAVPDGLMVPAQAVIPTPTGHAVFVLGEENKAKQVEITVGLRTAEQVQALRGLKPGDVVIASNLLRVRPGALVKPAQEAAR